MKFVILYLLIYIFIFGLYMLYFLITKKRNKKILEAMYLESKYKVSKLSKNFKVHVALINSLIFTCTIIIMNMFDSFIVKLLVAFASIMFFIMVFYKLLSLLYKRKK